MATPYPEKKIGSDYRRKVYEVKPENWNLILPYSFKVIKKRNFTSSTGLTNIEGQLSGHDGSSVEAEFEEFILPVNPQNISISNLFTSKVSATNAGILEENNGVVFRNIVISGTFGIAPNSRARVILDNGTAVNRKSELPASNSSGNLRKNLRGDSVLGKATAQAQSLAPNTVGAARSIVSGVNRTLASIGQIGDVVSGIESTEVLEELGYAKVHKFLNYLVTYSELKKKRGFEDYRLIFVNRKDNVSYVVTPISFDTQKKADNPHIIEYRVVLRGWDLAEETARDTIEVSKVAKETPNFVATLFNALRGARSVTSRASSTLRAVVQDFDTNFEIINELVLYTKELAGLSRSISDFDDLVKEKWDEVSERLEQSLNTIVEESTNRSSESDVNILNSIDEISSFIPLSKKFDANNPSGLPVGNKENLENFLNQQSRDNLNPLDSTEGRIKHVDLISKIPLSAIPLNDAEQQSISNKINRIKNFTIEDFDRMRSSIESMRDNFADYVGLGDDTVNSAFSRQSKSSVRTANSEDYKVLKSLNDFVSVIDSLTSSRNVIGRRIVDPFLRARINANNPAVDIIRFQNGFPIPFPEGATLETLANRYLGSPDKWIEIAVANRLKPPYIDMVGFERSFTSSGTGNVFTISNNKNLFLNQEITISSDFQLPSVRKIVSIKEITSSSFIIRVDGDSNLDLFTKTQNAKMKAFLPNTINPNKTILIPTNDPVPAANEAIRDTKDIKQTVNLDRQRRSMGTDLALTSDFDIALTSQGDVKIAAALENALQAVKLKIGYEKGALKRHPEVGLGLRVGERLQLSASEIRRSLENAILGDKRFSDVPEISVEVDGPIVRVNIRVSVADGGDVVPLTFNLNTG